MGYAKVLVTAHLLIDALRLPPDTEILGVQPEYSGGYCDVLLTVSHPDLKQPASPDGEIAPLVAPSFRKQEPVVFVDWGQQ